MPEQGKAEQTALDGRAKALDGEPVPPVRDLEGAVPADVGRQYERVDVGSPAEDDGPGGASGERLGSQAELLGEMKTLRRSARAARQGPFGPSPGRASRS